MPHFLSTLLLYLTTLFTSWNGYQHTYLTTSTGEEIHRVQTHNPQANSPSSLLLFHGLGSQAADLFSVMQPLRAHFKEVSAIDLPGHGLNQMRITDRPIAEIQTQFFETLHRDIGIHRKPVILWGNSLGGWQAIHYALRYPEDVKALILISPAGALESATQSQHLSTIFLDYSQNAPQKMLPLLFNNLPAGADLFAASLKSRFASPGLQALMPKLTPESMTFSTAQLRNLRVPTLLIWGKADRIFPEEAAYFKSHLPGATTTVIEPEHFTHSPYLEGTMSEELSQFTLNWLKNLPY
jgi:pimeloyl-ACP methyl ester carboxylesterase